MKKRVMHTLAVAVLFFVIRLALGLITDKLTETEVDNGEP